jgi:hypothetical protein
MCILKIDFSLAPFLFWIQAKLPLFSNLQLLLAFPNTFQYNLDDVPTDGNGLKIKLSL